MSDLPDLIRGGESLLNGVLERSGDMMALHRAVRGLRLLGDGATAASAGDHPLIAVTLEWRDRYVRAREIADDARSVIDRLKKEVKKIKDDDARQRAADDMRDAMTALVKYEEAAADSWRELRNGVQAIVNAMIANSGTEVKILIEDVRYLRSELDLQRKKVEAGTIGRIADSLRVSAAALMSERRRRLMSADGIPPGAEAADRADG